MNIMKHTTPNKIIGRKDNKPDMIVSHITEGGFNGAVSWLKNPKSGGSAHFVISKKGEIVQLVDLKDTAWANGTSVDITKSPKVHYSKAKLKSVRDRKTNANYFTVSIEHEAFSKEGGALTNEQLKASIWLHKHIIEEVKKIYGVTIPVDREHIVGHFEINPITKPNCPGPKFPWKELIDGIKGEAPKPVETKKPDSTKFKAGDIVKITANKYSTGQTIPTWVRVKSHPVKQVSGDTVLLGGINSWVHVDGLVSATITVGSKVRITGNTYATGTKIPGWVKLKVHEVSRIDKDKVLLGAKGGINSWVLMSDVKPA